MIDPYRMIFVNIVGSLLILISTLFVRFIYPKKKINLFYLLISFTFIASISILRNGTYESGDFNIHIYRSMEFYNSLIQGSIMPSWAANLNATYGYPLFIFNYTLPYYFISLFHFLELSFINSLKLFLFLNMILSGIFMYIFIQNKFKKDLISFVSSIFYVFAPYHLISVHFKITIGEILAYTFIPLCFLFIDKFTQKNKIPFLILSGLMLGLIAISHIFIAIVFIPIIMFYLLITLKNWLEAIKYSCYVFIVGMVTSLYQWLPPFLYQNHLFITYNQIDFSKLYFPNMTDLLFAPWRFGLLFQGSKGEISNLIGYAQIFVILSIIYLLFKKKIILKYINEILFWLSTLAVVVFMILPQSIPIWQYLPMINAAGSHRLLLIVGFIVSLLAGYLSFQIKNKLIIYLLVGVCIFSTILNWGHRRVIPQIEDVSLQKNLPLATYQGEHHYYAITKYVDPHNPWFSKIPQKNIQLLKGQADIKSIYRSSTNHQYQVTVGTKSIVRENTLYFPGWSAYANQNNLKIFPDKKGVININLPKGEYELTLRYEDLFLFKLSKIISLISLISIIVYLIFSFYKNTNLFPKVSNKD